MGMSVATVAVIVAVPVVHEEMHLRASGEQQIRQDSEDVRGMLDDQEEAGDRQEAAEHDSKWSAPPGPLNLLGHRLIPSTRGDYIMPIGPIITPSATFFCSSLKAA